MPALSRWFIRTALLALTAGLGIGLVTAVRGGAGLLAPTVLHLLVVGWLCYLTLNAGLVLRVLAEPATAGSARTMALAGSAALQLAAAAAFVANTWARVRTRG